MLTPYIYQVYPCWELCLLHIQLRYISRLGAMLTPYIAQVYIQVESHAYSIYSSGISLLGAMLTPYIAQVYIQVGSYAYSIYSSRIYLGWELCLLHIQLRYIMVGSYAYSIYSLGYIQVGIYSIYIYLRYISRVGAMLTPYIARYQGWKLCLLHIQLRYILVGSYVSSIYSSGISMLGAMLIPYIVQVYIKVGSYTYSYILHRYQGWEQCLLDIKLIGKYPLQDRLELCLLHIQLDRHISSLGAMLTQIAQVQNKRNSPKTKIMLIFET